MEKILFLDLEETIIKSWHNPLLCNVNKIKELLEKEDVKEVHIFSFAIHNDKDKQIFETQLKEPIENILDIKIISWPSVEEIRKEVFNFNNVSFDPWEFSLVWGKTKGFQDFCQSKFKDIECVLIDDVVPNSTFTLHDKNLIIRTIKI